MPSPLGGQSGLGASICAEVGIAVQTSFIGNQVPDAIQILALINAAGLELVQEWDWQALETEYRFTTQFLTTTGNFTAGLPQITGLASTAGIVAGTWMVLTSAAISQDSYVVSVDSSSQVTMSQPATITASGYAVSFAQTKYPMPAGFDRITDRTQWDKSKHWEMLGPETPQQWQWLKSGYISTGPRVRWRRMGNFLQTWPGLSTAEYLGFEYVSNLWAQNATTGTGQSAFLLDTDTAIFDDRLLISLTKRKYKQAKGMDTTAEEADYQRLLTIAKAKDKGAPMLSMAPGLSQVLVGIQNIPDTGYGT
jgi:hypothetical protein